MNQPEELEKLITGLREISPDILVYSGYTLEELQRSEMEAIQSVLAQISVLIDGAYIEDLNDNSLLRGSSNQQIHILNHDLEGLYSRYLQSSTNKIQNFSTVDGIISVGIHHKTF